MKHHSGAPYDLHLHELTSAIKNGRNGARSATPAVSANNFLTDVSDIINQRGKSRDREQGERAMSRTIDIFNAISGLNLTERQGYEFMIALKLARSQQGEFNLDDYSDLAGYTALIAEHLSQ